MNVRFVGTSAGEFYPGLWCRCLNCQQAREGSIQNRRQSASLYAAPHGEFEAANSAELHGGVLFDFPSEIATQAASHHIDLPGLQYLLVTHSHGDHWFPYLLRWRSRPLEIVGADEVAPVQTGGPRFTDLPLLHIWGNAAVEAVLHRELGENLTPFAIEFHRVQIGDVFEAGHFHVTALHANHDVGREEALHYVLQNGDCTLLYGLDGDTFLPETREALRAFRFDAVILEATYGFGNGRNHRNFARVIEEAAWFRSENLLKKDGRIIATHFSPHHSPPHQETADFLHAHAILAAWDGMEIEI